MKQILSIGLLVVLFSACSLMSDLTRESQYPKIYEEQPVTLLIMPPINNTTHVDAKELLYTSISKPLSEAGYYVISPLLTMDILKAESAYDAELFVEGSLAQFKNYFGADAVVFSEIHAWSKKGFGIQTKIRYFIRSTTTGEIIFDRNCDLYLDLQVESEKKDALSTLLSLAASALNTAISEHITAARKANYYIFNDIPRGKYNPMFLKDNSTAAEEKNITKSVK